MSCNWCQDEDIAKRLIPALCGKESESWKQEANNDLCYCTPCVREYHRVKNEFVKERPECEKILYKIEEERLRNHFSETLNQQENLPGNVGLSEFPYDIEDYLKVPILELLNYPYLLFNNELMNLFTDCLVLLINNGKFPQLDEKLPGLYLLLVNPCLQARQWALKTAKELGTISLEDYHIISPVINFLLKIILYGLDENQDESQSWPIPMTTIDDDTNPLPHLYQPLSKKDLWLGLGVIFNALDEHVLRILFSVGGHCQVLGILKNVLESKDPDSEGAFWSLLFCLKVLMTKLESTFWLLTDFDDAPRTTFRLILLHSMHKKELKSLAAKHFEVRPDTAEDEVTLSQLENKNDDDGENNNGGKKLRQPFFWMLPYIITVIDLEDFCEKVTCDVINYLLSLIQPSTTFWSNSLPTELDYFVLNSFCDILKYLIDHKLTFLIKSVSNLWISIMCRLRFGHFNMDGEAPPKRWAVLVRKSHSILIAMLNQVADVSHDKTATDLLVWLRMLKPGKTCDNQMVMKLTNYLPKVLHQLSKLAQSGLSVMDLENSRLFSFSSEDDFHEEMRNVSRLEDDGATKEEDGASAEGENRADGMLEDGTCGREEKAVRGEALEGDGRVKEETVESEMLEEDALRRDQPREDGTKDDSAKMTGTLEKPIYIIDSDDDYDVFVSPTKVEEISMIEPISYEDDLDYSEEVDGNVSEFKNDKDFDNSNEYGGVSTSDDDGGRFRRPMEVELSKGIRSGPSCKSSDVKTKENVLEKKEASKIGVGETKASVSVKVSDKIEISDSDSDGFLTQKKPPVKYSYGKNRGIPRENKELQKRDSLSDENKKDRHFESSDEGSATETLQVGKSVSLKKGGEVVIIQTSDENDDENIKEGENVKRQENLAPRRVRETQDVKRKDNGKANIKIGSVELRGDETEVVQLENNLSSKSIPAEEHKKDKVLATKNFYSETKIKDDNLRSLKMKRDKIKQGKRKHEESDERNIDILQKASKRVSENRLDEIVSVSGADDAEEVKVAKDNGSLELSTKQKKERADKDQTGSNKKQQDMISPLKKRGLFDFIGEIKKNNNVNDRNEMYENDLVLGKEKIDKSDALNEDQDNGQSSGHATQKSEVKNDVSEEVKGHATDDHSTDQNDQAEKKMSSEAFQRRKSILYDQYVKKQRLRASLDEGTQNIVNDVIKSPKKDVSSEKDHAMEEIAKDIEKMTSLPQESLPEVRKHKLYTIDSLLRFILSWHPVWISNEQLDELSITLPCEPRMVQHKYTSYDDYMYTMWPLVLIEFFAQMIKDYKERDKEQLDYKFKAFDPVIELQQFRIIHCESVQEFGGNGSMDPCENDLVIFRCADEHIIEGFGVIEEVERTCLSDAEDPKGSFSFTLINLKIKVANLTPGMKISSLQIEIVTSMISLYRRWEALMRMPKSLLCGDILSPFRPQVFELANGKKASDAPSDLAREFNPGQCNAIMKITEAVVQAFPLPKLRLLQGPPGTGKTHTLKGLVKNILQSLSKCENSRILICAASNAAVDEIVLRLRQDPPRLCDSNSSNKNGISQGASRQNQKQHITNCGDFNLLRIGSKSQIDPKVTKFSLEYLVNNELDKIKMQSDRNSLKSEIHKIALSLRQLDKTCTKLKMSGDKNKHSELKKKMAEREQLQRCYEDLQKKIKSTGSRRDPKEEEKRLRTYFLTRADIICCTLNGSGSKHMVNAFRNEWNIRNGTPFACVIIDEAGQCCEPEAMIPLQFGSSKLVLVGDPAQLPATVLSKRASRYGYGQSLFERIQSAFLKHTESPVLMLQEQYRMHPAICEFPSQKFYHGNLMTAREVLQRQFNSGIQPMVVLNINNSREANESFGVIHNPEERKYVTHICKEIVKRGISKHEKIGVITPYRKQLQELRNELKNRKLNKIEVNTIDGFQGREKDIIILSCVRAQRVQFGIGFLQDAQRMNVALTRAKHSLILVVHAESLQIDEDWKDLMKFARSRHLLFDIASTNDADNAVFVNAKETLHHGPMRKSNSLKENGEAYSRSQFEALPIQSDNSSANAKNAKAFESRKVEAKESNKDKALEKVNEFVDGRRESSHTLRKKPIHSIGNSEDSGTEKHKTEVTEKERSCDNNTASKQGDRILKSPRDVVTKKLPNVGTRAVKFPHVHSDGTRCTDKCAKILVPSIDSNLQSKAKQPVGRGKLPHVHSDGTKCVDKCAKMGERPKVGQRSIPSIKYLILPHDHSDGTRCVEKCVRLEAREKQRRDNEIAIGIQAKNGKSDIVFNYIRENSITQGPSDNDSDVQSCSVSPEIQIETNNNKMINEIKVKDSSRSVSLPNGNELSNYEAGRPVVAVTPTFNGKSKAEQFSEKEKPISDSVLSKKDAKYKENEGKYKGSKSNVGNKDEKTGKHEKDGGACSPPPLPAEKFEIGKPPPLPDDNPEKNEKKEIENENLNSNGLIRESDELESNESWRQPQSNVVELREYFYAKANVLWQQASNFFALEGSTMPQELESSKEAYKMEWYSPRDSTALEQYSFHSNGTDSAGNDRFHGQTMQLQKQEELEMNSSYGYGQYPLDSALEREVIPDRQYQSSPDRQYQSSPDRQYQVSSDAAYLISDDHQNGQFYQRDYGEDALYYGEYESGQGGLYQDHREGMIANEVPYYETNQPASEYARFDTEGYGKAERLRTLDASRRMNEERLREAQFSTTGIAEDQGFYSVQERSLNEKEAGRYGHDRTVIHHEQRGKVAGEETASIHPDRLRLMNKNRRNLLLDEDGGYDGYRNRSNRSYVDKDYSEARRDRNSIEIHPERQRNIEPQERRGSYGSEMIRATIRDDVTTRNVSGRGRETKSDPRSRMYSQNNCKTSIRQREISDRFTDIYAKDFRVSVQRNNNPSKRRKRSNENTEISPRKAIRTEHAAGPRRIRETRIEEITQKIRARNETRYRATQLLDSPASVNKRSPTKGRIRRRNSMLRK